MSNNKRLNFDVPKSLVPHVRNLADMEGQTPAYWLRKKLERVVSEEVQKMTGKNKVA